MKPLVRLGYLAAACALLVATFAIIGPRTARALVATLVQVTNTTAQPVLSRDVDNSAYEPFAETLCAGVSGNCLGSESLFTVPTTDPNSSPVRRLVIEYYSTVCSGVTPSNVLFYSFIVFTGGRQNSFNIGPLQLSSNASTGSFYYSNQQTRIYADPGTIVALAYNNAESATCDVTFTGYLVLK